MLYVQLYHVGVISVTTNHSARDHDKYHYQDRSSLGQTRTQYYWLLQDLTRVAGMGVLDSLVPWTAW